MQQAEVIIWECQKCIILAKLHTFTDLKREGFYHTYGDVERDVRTIDKRLKDAIDEIMLVVPCGPDNPLHGEGRTEGPYLDAFIEDRADKHEKGTHTDD